MRPSLLALAAVAGCVAPAGLSSDAAPDAAPDAPAPPDATARSSRFRADPDGWSASVPALRVEGRFDADGARFADEQGGTLSLRTVGWGRAGALTPIAGPGALAAAVTDAGSDLERLSFTGVGANEWWRTLDAGFAQGFTLAAAPEGQGPVVLDLHVEGATVSAWASGDGADLTRDDGSVWRYAGIRAWDADGAPLAAWIEGEADTLRLLVDDVGARWPVTVDPIVTTAASTFNGPTADSWMGQALAGGDVNGDGFDDLVVSAYRASYSGIVWVYHGSAAGFGATPDATLYPATSSSATYFGWQIVTGDFDADGYADVAVSEPGYNNGSVYVYAGTASGVRTTAYAVFAGTTTGEQTGLGLAAGDWNGDGYDDLVATNPYRDRFGTADVHYGGSSGISTTITVSLTGGEFQKIGFTADSVGDVDGDGYDDFVTGHYEAGSYFGRAYVFRGASTGLAQTRLTTITGPVYDEYFGRMTSGLGDVNGDGYDDVGVGAPGGDIPHDGSGAMYVYYGAAAGVSTRPDATLYGTGYSDQFGWAIAAAGDTDGDGFDDVIVGAPYATGASYANGAAYVIPGSAAGLVSGDADKVYSGTTPYELYGWEVAGLGDINGDGLADVGVGHPERSSRAGAAYVYLGTDGSIDADGDGYYTSGGLSDCDDADPAIHPGVTEDCDGVDQDCDGTIDDGAATTYYADVDGDGYGSATVTLAACELPTGYVTNGLDCDDTSALARPGGAEVIGSGIDEDCDGTETCRADADRDGHGTTATVASVDADCTDPGEAITTTDCDDTDAAVSPGATEVIGDGTDQDCDGAESCFADADGDDHGSATTISAGDLDCADDGEATVSDDCDDADATVFTGADEVVADGVDQDCDGGERCYVDADGDTFGTDTTHGSIDLDCADAAEAAVAGDCDDASLAIHPGAEEVTANGVDEDCDGGDACYADADGDGNGSATIIAATTLACDGPGEATGADDCDDTEASAHPGGTEVTGDGVDQDCDGAEICYVDADGDGQGTDATVVSEDLSCDGEGEAEEDGDCDDEDEDRYDGADELPANGVDEDCDDGDLCYADEDGDGFGTATLVESPNLRCDGGGESTSDADCDDASASSFPGAAESCNQVDDNCDGFVDEGLADCEAIRTDECGCTATSGSEGAASLVALVSMALLRRRRSSTRGNR